MLGGACVGKPGALGPSEDAPSSHPVLCFSASGLAVGLLLCLLGVSEGQKARARAQVPSRNMQSVGHGIRFWAGG